MTDMLSVIMKKLFPPHFSIRIKGGETILSSGIAKAAFVRDCGTIVRNRGIGSGWIWGTRTSAGIRLEFTSGIGAEDRQRFRNVLGTHTQ